jgi:hypothetical protein
LVVQIRACTLPPPPLPHDRSRPVTLPTPVPGSPSLVYPVIL